MARQPRARRPRQAEPLEDRLEGSWWDGADKDVRRMLGRLRQIGDQLAELDILVRGLPAVRKSKTRPPRTDTAMVQRVRQLLLHRGDTPADADAFCLELFLREGRSPDAARMAVKRLRPSGPKPNKSSR
jgi:hypothetical protein